MSLTKITNRVIEPNTITANSLAAGISLGGGGPKITNVSVANSSYSILDDTAIALEGGYLVITGTGFETGCQVIVGSNNATSTTFVNSTTLRAQVGAADAGSKAVYVVNPDGGTAIRVNGTTYSATPTWVTSSSLPGQAVNNPISIQLSASDAVTYQLQAGSTLPTGLTLSANGLLSGTITGVVNNTNYSFIIEAIDTENQESPRTFNLAIEASDFDISPSVSGLESWKFDTNGDFVLSSNGEWTMTTTSTKTFNVKMWGAGGGRSAVAFVNNPSINNGGGGGYISGNVTIPAGTYKIRVGGGGFGTGTGGYNGGGAGGTAGGGSMAAGGGGSTGIYLNSVSHGSVVIIAAGGGGGAGNDNGPIGRGGAGGGNTGQDGTNGATNTGGGGGTQSSGGAAGVGGFGVSLNTGEAGTTLQGGAGGNRGPSGSAGGGGGAGYYGGAGGGGTNNNPGGGGGGGGSSFANTSFVSSVTSTTGNYETPGNNSDSDRGTAGTGATTVGGNGNAGKIVIRLVS